MPLFKRLICPYCLTEIRSWKHPYSCPKCKSKLPVLYVDENDRHPPFFVQMFGWSGVGKTTFLWALTLMLVKMSNVWPQYFYYSATDASQRKVQEINAYFAKGKMPPMTQLGPQESYIMILKGMELFGGRSLVIRDCAGEIFDTMEVPLDQVPYLLNTPTTLMLISLPDLVYSGGRLIEMLLNNYINTLMKNGVDFDKEHRKLVVVLTKADMIRDLPIGLRDYLSTDPLWAAVNRMGPVKYLDATAMHKYLIAMQQVSDVICDWMQRDASGKAFLRLAENKNIEMRFSLISSTGTPVGEDGTMPVPLSPRRVLDPFFWALAFQHDDVFEGELIASGRVTSTDGDLQMPDERGIQILFLAANPTDTTRLRLDQEIREIDRALRQAEFRDRFDIRQHWAVRVGDLQELLLRHKPDIVHFSGHGGASSEIILEDNSGKSHSVSARALSSLFSALRDNVRCVVLNACYSEQQARVIAEHIDCVIGMSGGIDDASAISFAAAFYQALGYGKDIKTAFDLGCVQIDLENLDEQDVPELLAKKVDPENVVFVTGG